MFGSYFAVDFFHRLLRTDWFLLKLLSDLSVFTISVGLHTESGSKQLIAVSVADLEVC